MNKFSNKSLNFFAFLSFVVLLYIIYRAEFHFSGYDRNFIYAKYLKYIFLSIFFTIFFLLVKKVKEDLKINLVTSIYAIVATLYLVEIFLAFNYNYIFKQNVNNVIKKKDIQKKIIKYENLILQNIYPLHLLKKEILLEDDNTLFPLGSISKNKIYLCDENGTEVYYISDKYGFRNGNEIWNGKLVDYLLLGDSFIQGVCVEDKYTISNNIKETYNFNVLNLGISGAGPLKEYAIFNEYGKEKKPKKVFWFFYEGNDLSKDLRYEKSIPTLLNYLEDGFTQNLIKKQSKIDSLLVKSIKKEIENEKKNILNSRIKPNNDKIYLNKLENLLQNTKYIRLWGVRNLVNKVFGKKDIDPLLKTILKKTKDQVNSWDGELYFVYLPEKKRYSIDFNNFILKENFRNKSEVIQIVKELDIKIIDIDKDLFRNLKLEKVIELIPNHYSEEGYKLIANKLIEGK